MFAIPMMLANLRAESDRLHKARNEAHSAVFAALLDRMPGRISDAEYERLRTLYYGVDDTERIERDEKMRVFTHAINSFPKRFKRLSKTAWRAPKDSKRGREEDGEESWEGFVWLTPSR